MEDDAIVRLFLERNEDAIRFVSEKYGARIRKIAMGITLDIQTSEECENDTYMQAWNLIPPNEPRTYLYAFLARIVRHIAIDRCREQNSLKRDAFIVELTEEMAQCLPSKEEPCDKSDEKRLGEAVSKYLLSIPQHRRMIFVRRYFYYDSISEIAGRFSISESKVKSSLFRTRSGLRNYLLKEGYTI